MLKISYFSRKKGAGVSIERMYKAIADVLALEFDINFIHNAFPSKGLFYRLADIIRVVWYQGHVNHVLGDIHYVTYLMSTRKTVLTIHDCVMVWRSRWVSRWILWFFWLWLPVKRCAVVVAISESTRNQVIKHTRCNPAKVSVIHDPVLPEFLPYPKLFNASHPRILHLGTLEHKNLDRHIQALTTIPCEFVVIGRLSDQQEQLLNSSGLVYTNYCGLSDAEILEQYQLCDLVLFASIYEGFGLPIVEAQAVGRPVITSRLWSMPEVAGDAGCLVDPYNIESIRSAVLRIIHDHVYREDLIAKGFENVKRFSVDKIAGQYAQLYREIADGMR